MSHAGSHFDTERTSRTILAGIGKLDAEVPRSVETTRRKQDSMREQGRNIYDGHQLRPMVMPVHRQNSVQEVAYSKTSVHLATLPSRRRGGPDFEHSSMSGADYRQDLLSVSILSRRQSKKEHFDDEDGRLYNKTCYRYPKLPSPRYRQCSEESQPSQKYSMGIANKFLTREGPFIKHSQSMPKANLSPLPASSHTMNGRRVYRHPALQVDQQHDFGDERHPPFDYYRTSSNYTSSRTR
jgi:hypothetical protein